MRILKVEAVTDDRSILESKAAELAAKNFEWNELDFVGWKEFRRMAPAVVGLEGSRLERLMQSYEPGTPTYNGLVRARFELRQFVDGIESSSRESLGERAEHLRRALLALSLLADDETESLKYIVYRLTYVYQRINLVY